MKKILIAAMAFIMAVAATARSNGNAATTTAADATTTAAEAAESKTPEFTEEDGVLTYLDTENSPFEGAGLKITADPSAKTVKFVKTDLEGNETVEYYTFDFNTNTVEEYYFVSMMGTGFYYTFDLEKGEISKIEDSDRNDSTQSTKDSGRYDSANERTKGDVEALQKYFSEQFGKEIADMVK